MLSLYTPLKLSVRTCQFARSQKEMNHLPTISKHPFSGAFAISFQGNLGATCPFIANDPSGFFSVSRRPLVERLHSVAMDWEAEAEVEVVEDHGKDFSSRRMKILI